MEKTIKIGKKSVRLSNNISWAIAYRDQFGKDIIPALMPALAGVMDLISGLISETGKTDNIEFSDIVKLMDGDTMIDAAIHFSGLEFVDLINVTWALAKSADDDIPDPAAWVKEFDQFPVDIIAPEVFRLIFSGVISSKNLKRLKDLKKRIQPLSTSTQLSSQDLKEG